MVKEESEESKEENKATKEEVKEDEESQTSKSRKKVKVVKVVKTTKEETPIIKYLEEKEDYTPTVEIAKEIFGSKGTASQVNPTLYGLLTKGLVKKKAEPNGSKPRWKLKKKMIGAIKEEKLDD